MRVLVCGSRTWDAFAPIFVRLAALPDDATVVHGAAPGADTLAGRAARLLGLTVEEHPAEWDKHGKRAGYLRNRQMIDSGVDLVIAFSRDDSRGTANTIDLARRCGLPLEVHEWPS